MTSKSSLPVKKPVPKSATKDVANKLYGGGAVNRTQVNKKTVSQQGAGDNVKRKQIMPMATSLGPAHKLYGSKK